MKKTYLEAGKIVNTHGINGEVKVMPWADSPDFLLDFEHFYIDNAPVKVLSARVHKQSVLMLLDGVDNINAAMRMKDKLLYIKREDVTLPAGKHFIVDLYGLTVLDADSGAQLGKIVDVLTPPAQTIYVVRGGAREYMIPAVDAFVLETNVADGFIKVRLIEGM